MIDLINEVLTAIPNWVVAITGVVTAASAVTMLTPSKTDDAIVSKILGFLNMLALNVGKNKNADTVE